MQKEKIRDAFDYIQFPATLSVFSVGAIDLLQKTFDTFSVPLRHGPLLDNPMNVSIVAAFTGVSVGNAFMNDHAIGRCLPHGVYATILGYLAGSIAAEHIPSISPLAGAFAAAGAGLALRRNLKLYEGEEQDSSSRRNRYDDLDY